MAGSVLPGHNYGRVGLETRYLARQMAEAASAFAKAYAGTSLGHGVATSEGHLGSSFTYGEVVLDEFIELLGKADPRPGEVFVDLGAGTGKAVQAAALSPYGFRRCVGVEIVGGLHAISCKARDSIAKDLGRDMPVDLVLDDMLRHPWWHEADVVYTSSICFSEDLWRELQKCMRSMKAGSRLLTLKTPDMSGGHWESAGDRPCRMTWGVITVRIFRRTSVR